MKSGLETRVALKRSQERIIVHREMPNVGRGNERYGIKICSDKELEGFKKLSEFEG